MGNLINTVIAASAPAGGEEESSSFLVSPSWGLMIWTLVAFGIVFLVVSRYALPKIQEAIDARRDMIEESIKYAETQRNEADQLLADYRQRLAEARAQSDEIVAKARKAGDQLEADAKAEIEKDRQEQLEQNRREIQLETEKSLQDLRREVANLTVIATEKVTRKSLSADDQQRLVEEALNEVDFSALSGEARNN